MVNPYQKKNNTNAFKIVFFTMFFTCFCHPLFWSILVIGAIFWVPKNLPFRRFAQAAAAAFPPCRAAVSTTRGSTFTTRHPACRSSACRSARRTAHRVLGSVGANCQQRSSGGMAPSPSGKGWSSTCSHGVFLVEILGNSIVGGFTICWKFQFLGDFYTVGGTPPPKKRLENRLNPASV